MPRSPDDILQQAIGGTLTLEPPKYRTPDDVLSSIVFPKQQRVEQTDEELRQQVIEASDAGGIFDTLGEAIAGVPRGAGKMIGSTIEGVAGLGRAGAEAVGLDPDIAGVLPFIQNLGQSVREGTEEALPVNPAMEGGWTQAIAEGVGSTIPAIAATAAGGIPAVVGMGAASGYADTYAEARRNGATHTDAKLYGLLGAAVTGATEPIGAAPRIVKMFKRLDAATGKFLGKELAKKTVETGGWEALQEAVQEIPNETARQAYQEERGLIDGLAAVGEAGLVGGIVGVILGGTASALKRRATGEQSGYEQPQPDPEPLKPGESNIPDDPAMATPGIVGMGENLVGSIVAALSADAKTSILAEHESRVEKGQKDPTPSAKQFEDLGAPAGTSRKARAAAINAIKAGGVAVEVGAVAPETADLPPKAGESGGETADQAPLVDAQVDAQARRDFPAVAARATLRPGMKVRPADRNNLGTVVAANGDRATVAFYNRKTGERATRDFEVASLRDTKGRSFPVAEALQDQATVPPNALGFAKLIGDETAGVPIGSTPTPPASYWPNAKVAGRVDSMRKSPKVSMYDSLRKFAAKAWHIATRPQEHLPNDAAHASANEFFRIRKDVPKHRVDEVTRTLGAITAPLDKPGYRLMGDLLLARDIKRGIEEGMSPRFGFANLQEVESSIAQMEAMAAQSPTVQMALDGRHKVATELVQELVDAKLLPRDTLGNVDAYFHREVRKYMEAENASQRATKGTKSPKQTKAGFQKGRVKGDLTREEYDFGSDYLMSEFRWMVDAHTKLAAKRLWSEFIEDPYDIAPRVRAEAKAKDEADWMKLIPDTHGVYQVRPGNPLFRAFSVERELADKILEQGLGEISAADLKEVTVMGGPFKQYVLPNEIILELKKLEADAAQQKHIVDSLVVDAMSLWKQYILMKPTTVAAYNVRNMFGDADVVIAGLPSAIGKSVGATKELWGYFHRGDFALSEDLRNSRDLAVMDAAMTVQEVPDIGDLRVFERFYDHKFSPMWFGPKVVKGWFNTAKKYSTFREAILRYSSYKKYLDAIRNDKISHFGAANEKVVRELIRAHGPEVAAAHMARNLLGDYGNTSVLSKWISSHLIPFWSYQHTLLERYPRIVINSAKAGGWKKATPAAAVAALRILTASRIAWLAATATIWNKLFRKDEEDDLAEYDQANPHIVLGRNPDGSVRILRNFGAFGEFLEWFGLNTASANFQKVLDGQWTAADLAKEMAWDPANKVIQSIRPDLKTGGEAMFGRTIFPDVRNPRTVEDRGELIAGGLGLRDEYRWAKGKLLQQGDRARPHYTQRWITGVVDPRPNAMIETHSLIDRFLKTQEKARPDLTGNPLSRNMRRAVEADDREAFAEAKAAYIASGKGWKDFKRYREGIDPVSHLSKKDRRAFYLWITPRQKEKVRVGRDYANEVAATMSVWWRETPVQAAKR